ncbi:hypothetical protein [Holdemania massiliensis]|uniref:hypothetical protein n=1 Tax=Holdemania massiliensis TaxID=1468449 RepID=UPI001F05FCF1|nr:hypothetical protein [Holdemania massiliensis]MCH1942416.1 hypothetical protein [Holdemania massiliensis]
MEERMDFELYKSTVCHRVKDLGDLQFMINVLENNEIRDLFNKNWYPESLYLLAMIDYLSRIHSIQLCTDYDDIRNCKLKKLIYPAGVMVSYFLTNDPRRLEKSLKDAIPEFLRHNIVESEIRNVA